MKNLFMVVALIISTQSFAQASTNRSQMKQLKAQNGPIIVGSKYSLINKIKSCLAVVYTTQAAYRAERGTYISSNQEFVADTADSCQEIDVTTEIANQNEFRAVARSGNQVWAVNQNKEIIQLR